MSKETLLELVQGVLSDIDGDEVNTISDTVEAEQVAGHIKNAYNAIVSNSNWAHTRRAVALVPRSNNNFPTHMTIQENLKELISVRYNRAKLGETKRDYHDVTYCTPDDFLRRTNNRDNDRSDTDIVVDDSGIELLILNNKAPEYYTSFDDVNIVFDSYDSEADSTLQQSKFQAQGYIIPEFRIEDSFVPDLPADAFSLLYEESVSRAQFKLRQIEDVKSETESRRQARWMSRKAWTVNDGEKRRDYGRKVHRVQRVQPWPRDG